MPARRRRIRDSDVIAVLRLMQAYDVVELRIEQQGASLHLTRDSAEAVTAVPHTQDEPEAGFAYIRAPAVGHFYRALDPETPPLLDIGQQVEVGQVVGFVETLDVLNDVHADCAGEVVEVLAENGEAVDYGRSLFQVKVAGRAAS